MADNEGREGSRGKTISSPHEAGAYIPRAVLAALTFHQNHLGSVLEILVKKVHSGTIQSRLLEVRDPSLEKVCLFVCLLVVRPPDDFIVKFGMRIIALQQKETV